jgi:hypothetical protein
MITPRRGVAKCRYTFTESTKNNRREGEDPIREREGPVREVQDRCVSLKDQQGETSQASKLEGPAREEDQLGQ